MSLGAGAVFVLPPKYSENVAPFSEYLCPPRLLGSNPAPALVPVSLPLGINTSAYLDKRFPHCPTRITTGVTLASVVTKNAGQSLLGLLKIAIEGKIETETPRVITL